MTVTVYIARAFCRNSHGGNLAGVVILDEPILPSQMQKMASLLNFSETIFLLKKSEQHYFATYYTPTCTIDFCGHASIAAFGVLSQQGDLKSKSSTLKTPAGMCSISIANSFIFLSQILPVFGHYISEAEIASVLGIDVTGIISTYLKPQIISTGLRDIIIPVADQHTLFAIRPNPTQITLLSEKYDVVGVHVFALDSSLSSATAHCRNFAPRYGIPEESATGSSNGALACYLFKQNVIEKETMLFQQGDILGSPSDIYIRLMTKENEIEKVECGGKVVIDGIRMMELPLD